MTIIEKAQELGQMIIESDEYVNMQKAEMLQTADDEAGQLIEAYNKKRAELTKKLQDPSAPPEIAEEVSKQLDEEYNVLVSNKHISDYIDSMKDFNNLMNQINGILAYYVNGQRHSDCSGDCGSCGGTCH